LLVPKLLLIAIKLSVYRNAKPQLGAVHPDAKLELGVPSRADFTLDASLLVPKLLLGNGVFEDPASRRTAKQELAR